MTRPSVILATAALGAGLAAPASATDYVVQPVQIGQENARFDHGSAIIESARRNGTIQVRPLPVDHGSVVFEIAAFNSGAAPTNLDVSNIEVRSNGLPVSILTAKQLMGKEKTRTMWKQIGIAAVSALGSGIAASQRNHYRGTYSSRFGRSTYSWSAPSLAGQLQANAINQEGLYAMGAVQARLDQTRAEIGEANLELSTIDPGQSGGGRIVLSRFKSASYPQRVDMTISWNGDTYQFAFQIVREGTPQPQFANFMVPERKSVRPAAIAASSELAQVSPQVARPIAASYDPATSATSYAASEYSPPAQTPRYETAPESYEERLAAAQPVRGGYPKQGWTISD